ncbi:MAG: SDR family NAD(P)-dependent oxidoreductase [Methylomonas sp.]|nr:SDR family NAD(P)-dependent oxidoreductase [Methylomonas sp.]PPD22542.1 MAG: short-chain dehydrogenase [Methylomonas sp.]PPD27854.1 MAG: short-chain dehydrogenase [Methylomonas sp.]PPD39963.1 MAG: short-chain dehydrogenase [Methylomonas sp.]PPD41057.1 MAG: short-chain dehydrogenase [Methylomonas sp.]
MTLDKHVILVTGAGGGLGSAAAKTLAKQGAHIILLDNDMVRLEKTYDAIVEAGGPEPVMDPFDLAGATEAQYQDMADAIEQRYGSLQGLLHSAVEFSAFTPIALHKTRDWGHTLNVNLNAAFLLTRVLLPVMQKSPHASIVFTSDSAVRDGRAYSGAYGVSKIALEGFAKILAAELETAGGVRVNILVPGPVDSPLRKKAYPAEDKASLPAADSLDAVYRYLFDPTHHQVTGQIIDARTFKPCP